MAVALYHHVEHRVRTLVSFATQSDQVARQLVGRKNSFFTAALIEEVQRRGHCSTITDLVGVVEVEVLTLTRQLCTKGILSGVQEPCHTGGRASDVKLVPLASSIVDHFLPALDSQVSELHVR